MVNTFLNAVTKHLGTKLGTDYHYYVENVEQGLSKPCFTIDVISPTERSKSPILYDRTMPLVVHYFSDSKTNLKSDCYSMAELVIEHLEYLPFENSLLRGEDISWQITDGVLQIFVTYRFTTKRVEEITELFGDLTVVTDTNRPETKAILGVGVLGKLQLGKY